MAEEPMEEQEKGYEVHDKRRVNADGTIREEAAGEAPSTETAREIPHAEAEEQAEMPPPNIYAELQFMALGLSQLAWCFMGLRLLPGQKELVKDMDQAKLAIDTLVFIADKLNPQLEEEDRRIFRGMISDLQLNFVQQSSK